MLHLPYRVPLLFYQDFFRCDSSINVDRSDPVRGERYVRFEMFHPHACMRGVKIYGESMRNVL